MKKILLLLLLAWGTARADQAFTTPYGDNQVGEIIERSMPEYLYLSKKCELPLINAQHMRKYTYFNGSFEEVGCWGVNIDDEAVVIIPHHPGRTIPTAMLMLVDVRKDGTEKIIAVAPAKKR